MKTEKNISADGTHGAASSTSGEQSFVSTNPGLPPGESGGDAVNGQLLLDELRCTFERFVVLPKWGAETLALWTLHTHAFHLRDVSTYIGIESPVKRCGKTTLLAVLNKLAHRPVLAANISFKAFFRVIDQARPTLLIDETDTFLPGNDELRGIMNAGYHRETAFVIRFVHSGEFAPGEPRDCAAPEAESPKSKAPARVARHKSRHAIPASGLARFSCWCPKAMAAIGRLPETLADRCILIRMHRKTSSEKCERLRNLQAASLTGQCARFVLEYRDAIAEGRPEMPAALNDRAADIWEPLLALADLAGGAWPDLARQAAVALSGAVQGQDSDGLVGALLQDILTCLLMTKSKRMLSRELVEWLNALTLRARPWLPMLKGKEVTELWLSKTLRPYGIQPKNMRNGETVGRGYLGEDFVEIFERYLPNQELEAPVDEAAPVSAPTSEQLPSPGPSQSSSSSPKAPEPFRGSSSSS